MRSRRFNKLQCTLRLPDRPLWAVSGDGCENVLRDATDRGVTVAARCTPFSRAEPRSLARASHAKLNAARDDTSMLAERPQTQAHWHWRGAASAVAISSTIRRRRTVGRCLRCRRLHCSRSCLAGWPLHRLGVGVHRLKGADPGAIDRRAVGHLGPGPHAAPDWAGLAAEVNVPLASGAAPPADDPVRDHLRVVVDLVPAAVCRQCPARLAEDFEQPAAVAGLHAAAVATPFAHYGAGGLLGPLERPARPLLDDHVVHSGDHREVRPDKCRCRCLRLHPGLSWSCRLCRCSRCNWCRRIVLGQWRLMHGFFRCSCRGLRHTLGHLLTALR
jgi:hypothetical protein